MKNYILRKNKGKSHIFYDKRNNLIKDKKYIDDCISGIYIAPAYDNVKINLNKKAKVLAIGYDDNNRAQLLSDLEHVIEWASSRNRDRLSGQGNLFDSKDEFSSVAFSD